MPIYKTVLSFEGRKHGWKEGWWQNNTDTDYRSAIDAGKVLASKRAKLLGSQCKIIAVEVSREDETGEGLLEYVTYKGVGQRDAAHQDVGVLLTCRDALNKKRKHSFLRGIWDDVETEHGDYKKNLAVWKDNMKEFKDELTGAGQGGLWGWYGAVTKVKRFVSAITFDANNRMTLTYDEDYFAVGQIGKRIQIRMKGYNGKSGMNGTHIVTVMGERSAVTPEGIRHVPYLFGAETSWVGKDFIQIRSATDSRTTRRAAGSPLLDTAGRAKAKAKN